MPHEKRRSLRARMITLVLIPSTALLVLWAVLTTLMVIEIRELRTTAALTERIGTPVVSVIGQLQRERRATMDASGTIEGDITRLTDARRDTDEAVALLEQRLHEFDHDVLPHEALAFQHALDRLDAHRERVDGLPSDERTLEDTATPYTEVIESGLRFWDAQVARADPEQVPHLRSLTSLMRTRELLNQQDAVVAHSVATNAFPAESHAEFAAAAGSQHYTWARVGAELSDEDSEAYVLLDSYSAVQTVYLLQENIVGMRLRGTSTVPVNAPTWQGAAEAVDFRMRDIEDAQMERVVTLSHTHADNIRRTVLLTSVPALLVALASTAVAVGGTQRLVRRLQGLRTVTLEHARVRLPKVTARLRAGGSVDVDAEVPRLVVERRDEIGQVAEAFNDAQRAAVSSAVEEAQVRAGVRNMFRNIARRTQALVHRQLGLLDALERSETDPAALDSLFRIDHFSTQLRRNAENLLLLSGEAPGRRRSEPVRLHDAVRAAASEIEDYTRVRVLPVPDVSLRGDVGADLVRLLAELLENATSFSPPGTYVTVRGQESGEGDHVLEVEDRGLGMTSSPLERANALLADPPAFDLARMREDSQLGLFVAATIAARHGFAVTLGTSAHQGTRASVVVPRAVLAGPEPGSAAEDIGRRRLGQGAPSPRVEAMAAAREEVEAGPFVGPVTAPSPTGTADTEDQDTYKGLPRRRRGRMPDAVPGSVEDAGGAVAADERPQRPLSEIRSMMSAFQSGTLRGRAESEGPEGGSDERGVRRGEDLER